MDFTMVESTNLAAISYDPTEHRLFVRFKRSGGAVYAYEDVPPQLYDAMLNANSKGRFLNEQIKPGRAVKRLG